MAITNLTGTKWKLNDGFTATAGYGIFNVEIDVIISDTTYQSSVLYIGYTGDMMSNPTEQENSCLIEHEVPAFGLMPEIIGAGNLITFNSGADATNTNLITWIQANATQIITPIQVNMTKSSITLATKGTYCDKDIKITAALQSNKPAYASDTTQFITPDAGYAGLGSVELAAAPLQDITITQATDISQELNPDIGYYGFGKITVPQLTGEEKTVTITENGTTTVNYSDPKLMSKVTITTSVPAIVDVATAAEMNTKLVAGNVGKVYRFTGTTDSTYTNGDLYEVVSG